MFGSPLGLGWDNAIDRPWAVLGSAGGNWYGTNNSAPVNTLSHFGYVVTPTTTAFYVNGIAAGTAATGGASGTVEIGRRSAGLQLWKGILSDVGLWYGDLSKFMPTLANRSDPMLGGLLVPVWRRVYAAAVAAGAMRWPWQQRRHRRFSGAGA